MSILEKIANKELTPIGWGIGLMFKQRKAVHDFDVAFTIHTRPNRKSFNGIPIFQPSVLESIDRRSHVLIVYTVDYLNFVYDHCKKYDDLLVLPFNDYQLGIKKKLKNTTKNNLPFQNWGVFYENFNEVEDV